MNTRHVDVSFVQWIVTGTMHGASNSCENIIMLMSPISVKAELRATGCSPDDFPSLTTVILDEHKDEVWYIEWSHDGNYIATASKDRTAVIWHIGVRLVLCRVSVCTLKAETY